MMPLCSLYAAFLPVRARERVRESESEYAHAHPCVWQTLYGSAHLSLTILLKERQHLPVSFSAASHARHRTASPGPLPIRRSILSYRFVFIQVRHKQVRSGPVVAE